MCLAWLVPSESDETLSGGLNFQLRLVARLQHLSQYVPCSVSERSVRQVAKDANFCNSLATSPREP